jgi:hypothetical protein
VETFKYIFENYVTWFNNQDNKTHVET